MNTYDASLDRWLQNQMPRVVKKLAPKLVSVPPLHISVGTIRTFSPRIPLSAMPDEDKTVPRVCCSLDLVRCIESARHVLSTIEVPSRVYIYGFDERSVVQPSIELSQEPVRAGEVWVVPHRMSNWEIPAKVYGEMRLMEMGTNGGHFVFVVRTNRDLTFTANQQLKADRTYQLKVRVNQSNGIASVSDAKEIAAESFAKALNGYTVTV